MKQELTWPETIFLIALALLAAFIADGRLSPGTFLAIGIAGFGAEVLMQRKQRT